MESKFDIENIKSDYFLRIIFSYLKQDKSLIIVKCNKHIQKRLNLSIEDYKKFSETFTPIEIEIIPQKNRYKQFINMKDKKKYYQIYLNDNNENIKRNYTKKEDNATKIRVILNYHIKSFEGLFKFCNSLESIKFKKFYRNDVVDMKDMFFGCFSLKELNLDNFNSSNVTDMSQMFNGCSALTELNISKFNTNNVTDMHRLFMGCSSLTKLNLTNINTKNVTDMSDMFENCKSLKELNLSNFDSINVTNMRGMFFGCTSLKNLNIKF